MRCKIQFPHRTKPVEREVKEHKGRYYIHSKGLTVPVVPNGVVWEIEPRWQHLYEGSGKHGS